MRMRTKVLAGLVATIAGAVSVGYWQLSAVRPAASELYDAWQNAAPDGADPGAALLAFGNFGSLDLDTLETSALPWTIVATALALRASGGDADRVEMNSVAAAFRSFGFLFPKTIAGHPDLRPSTVMPFGLSVGVVERSFPPIRITAMTIGCAACHAGAAYKPDGSPNTETVVLGRPNTALDLEAFAQESYAAVKQALEDEGVLMHAMQRLFPNLTLRERLTLEWMVLPRLRKTLGEITQSIDRPLPFNNGAPGLTNGVAAIKMQLGVTARDHYVDGAGFVSIPDLADRNFRSAFLVDGAYAPKSEGERFRAITDIEAAGRKTEALAGLTSFFMVPTMGMTPSRAQRAIPEIVPVMEYLASARPARFPGPIDSSRAEAGRLVYARACASCHGRYDASLEAPRLLWFPNWAGDVGTDRSRVEAFTAELKSAVDATVYGEQFLDAAVTGVVVAPLLSGIWSSAPYLTNGSIPTLRHLLEPATRPVRLVIGGHKLDLERIGIAGSVSPDGTWIYPAGYQPFSKPVIIDTAKTGFSNRGHDIEVQDLTDQERPGLLEYLKLL